MNDSEKLSEIRSHIIREGEIVVTPSDSAVFQTAPSRSSHLGIYIAHRQKTLCGDKSIFKFDLSKTVLMSSETYILHDN